MHNLKLVVNDSIEVPKTGFKDGEFGGGEGTIRAIAIVKAENGFLLSVEYEEPELLPSMLVFSSLQELMDQVYTLLEE